jgi:hypothetical protein
VFLFQVLLKPILTNGKERTWWFPTNNQGGGAWVIPGPCDGDLSCHWARVRITYTHLQLKRRLRGREECSSWITILSQVFSKSPELSLILAFFTCILKCFKMWPHSWFLLRLCLSYKAGSVFSSWECLVLYVLFFCCASVIHNTVPKIKTQLRKTLPCWRYDWE